MTTTTTSTPEVIAGMFTENTGSHFLDSGGAYGRHHEKNAGLTLADFIKAPAVTTTDGYPELNTFKFLLERVEYAPALDAVFSVYSDESEDSHYQDLNNWPESIGAEDLAVHNTYNYDCNLSQTLQFATFSLGGNDYALIQVHGGADVRGGYTKPRVFILNDVDDLYDFCRSQVRCGNCDWSADYYGDSIEQEECGKLCGIWCGASENAIPDNNGPAYSHPWTLADGCPCCQGPLD